MSRIRDKDVVWQSLEDDVVILDLRTSLYLRLNSSAAFLWRALISDDDETMMIDKMTSEYGITDDLAAADVRAFLADLTARDLLSTTRAANHSPE